MFARFATWCARLMGSPRTFAVTLGLILAWLAAIPWMGMQNWNASLGLAGNTTESTIELLAAIAIQYVVNRSESGQREAIARIEALEQKIADREDAIAATVAEELALLRQALGLPAAPEPPASG